MSKLDEFPLDNRVFFIDDSPTQGEIAWIQAEVENHKRAATSGEYDQPGVEIGMALKDTTGKVWGGVIASTILWVMHLEAWTTLRNLIFEYLWDVEGYRGLDLGRRLMLETKKIARENGCIASQAYCFSFQALGFFQKMGYQILGVSNGYPPPVKEFYLIKKYQ